MRARRRKAVEEIRKIRVSSRGVDKLIGVRINRVDEGIGWQESVFDEFQDAAEIIVDSVRLRARNMVRLGEG